MRVMRGRFVALAEEGVDVDVEVGVGGLPE